MFKKIVSSIICFCIILGMSATGITAYAAESDNCLITVGTVAGITGDSVIVPITIENNPALMACAISITYNTSALEYEDFYKGDVFKDYTVVNFTNRSTIRFVNCESKENSADGTLLSLQFKIKDNAEWDFHKITIQYSKGDFSDWDLNNVTPEIVSGGVDVAYNGSNCSHKKYSDWTVAAEPSCEKGGMNQRICEKCGHVELKPTDPIGHEYAEFWTIDQPATKEEVGIMSRYCIRCDDFVDRMTFTAEQSEEGNFDNQVNGEVEINDYTENIFKEQFPNEELSESKPGYIKPSEKPESSGEKIADTIISIFSEDEETETIEIIDKISEAFPNYEIILSIFKIALLVLLVVILL